MKFLEDSNIRKKVLKILNFAFILFLSIVIFQTLNKVEASSYSIDDYKIEAKIKNNGDMHVVEYLKYRFSEDVNGVYRDILYKYNFANQKDDIEPTSSRYQANNVSNILAYTSNESYNNMELSILENESSLNNGMKGYYSIEDVTQNGYRKNVKVYLPSTTGSVKYIKYEYDLEDVAIKYNDVGEIYWNFVGANWDSYINNLNIDISFENKVDFDNVIVYPHSYTKDIQYNIDKDHVIITANNINPNVAVDARVLFDTSALDVCTKTIDTNYDFSALEKIEQKMTLDKKLYLFSNKVSIILIICGILGLLCIIYETHKVTAKGKKKENKIEVYTELIDKYDFGEVSALLNPNSGYSSSSTFISTLLDLAEKKYIILLPEKKVKKDFLSSIEYNYNMKLNAQKNYLDLSKYESLIINYLFNESVSEDKIENITNLKNTEIELNKKLKELSNKYRLKMEYNKKVEQLDKDVQEKLYNKVPTKLIRNVIIGIVVFLILLLVNMFGISPVLTEMSITSLTISVFLSIFAIFFILSAKSLKEEYVDDYNKIKGLKKYLYEYSKMKDRYPIEMALWGKYLIFACIFGIAKKVSKEFKDELISKGYDDDYIYAYYPIYNISSNFDYFNSSISNSTGSSSSGGYSGGGSGGGGGRRWWRRYILNV